MWWVQGSVAREVPESPRQAKAKAKENKKGRDHGMPATPARTPQTSEYAEQLKKVSLNQVVKPSPRTVSAAALPQGLHHCCRCHLVHSKCQSAAGYKITWDYTVVSAIKIIVTHSLHVLVHWLASPRYQCAAQAPGVSRVLPVCSQHAFVVRAPHGLSRCQHEGLCVWCQVAQFASYGRLFRSSEPVQLTEEETEYNIVAIKHVFPAHTVLQFQCTNTVQEQVLEDVSVSVDLTDAVSMSEQNAPCHWSKHINALRIC